MYRQVGSWATEKHYYLKKYLNGFVHATKKAMKRYYIDLFAGSGECQVRETGEIIEGSPKIALEVEPGFNHYFFVDIKEDYIQDLETLSAKYPSKKVTVIQGDCNRMVGQILDQIEKKSPTFVLLDPTNEAYTWTTIEALADYQTDLFVNLPFFMSTRRLLTRKGDIFAEDRLAEFFGPLDWRGLYQRMLNGENVSMYDYMQLYREGLRDLGYIETDDNEALIKNKTGQSLYYLILASKSPIARKIFDGILKTRPDGQKRLF